jgi:integrase
MPDTQSEKRGSRRTRGVYEHPKRSGIWWVCYFDEHGKRHREKVGPKGLAAKVYQKRKTEIAEHRFFPERRREPLVREAIESYLATRERARSVNDMNRCARMWRTFLGDDTRVGAVSPDDIRRYVRQRQATEVKDSSINRELAFLRAVFNELIEDEKWEGRNPVLSKFSKSEKKHRRTRYLLGEEEKRLMEALPTSRDRAIVGLAINVGFRRSNIFELTWDKIDFEAGLAWATDTKSGDDYSVPLSAEALAILQALPRTSRWVFPSETGDSPVESCNWYQRVFKPACERAAVRNLRFHDLRHTFASRLAMTGAQQKVIQTLLGHKTSAMTDRYTHLSAYSLRAAVERMGTATTTATADEQVPGQGPQVADSEEATRRSRTGDLLITNQLLYQLS